MKNCDGECECKKVIKSHQPLATCPECGCQEWLIHLDGFEQDYENITAHECDACGYKIEF